MFTKMKISWLMLWHSGIATIKIIFWMFAWYPTVFLCSIDNFVFRRGKYLEDYKPLMFIREQLRSAIFRGNIDVMFKQITGREMVKL